MKTCQMIRDLLSGYLDRELRPEDQKEVQRHLTTCAACRTEERAILQLKETLRGVPMPGMPRDVLAAIEAETILKARWWESDVFQRRWFPLMAGTAAAAVAGWLWMQAQLVPTRSAHMNVAVGISTSPAVALHQDPDKDPVNEDIH